MLWVDLEAAWALAGGVQPAFTCKRTWDSTGGRRNLMVGCPLATAAVSSCRVEPDRWIVPHVPVRGHFDCGRWSCRSTRPMQCSPLWPASWLPAFDMSRGLSPSRFRGFGRFMITGCSSWPGWMLVSLDESLGVGDVSRVWLVWSSATETALADVYRFAGGPVPDRGLIVGRGTARMRVVRLGGLKVRKARRNAADAHEGGDVFMYRDSSAAPLHDLRCGIMAVMSVLDAMIRDGISLARSVELTAQWDWILILRGPVNPITLEDFQLARSGGLGEVRRAAGDLHCWLSDFIHRVVVHRRDEAGVLAWVAELVT